MGRMDGQDCAIAEEPLVVLQQVAAVHNGITGLFDALGQTEAQEDGRPNKGSSGLVPNIVSAAEALEVACRRLRQVEAVIREAVHRMGE